MPPVTGKTGREAPANLSRACPSREGRERSSAFSADRSQSSREDQKYKKIEGAAWPIRSRVGAPLTNRNLARSRSVPRKSGGHGHASPPTGRLHLRRLGMLERIGVREPSGADAGG
jgi:hypothetical protein